jgi:hypothetical protein
MERVARQNVNFDITYEKDVLEAASVVDAAARRLAEDVVSGLMASA